MISRKEIEKKDYFSVFSNQTSNSFYLTPTQAIQNTSLFNSPSIINPPNNYPSRGHLNVDSRFTNNSTNYNSGYPYNLINSDNKYLNQSNINYTQTSSRDFISSQPNPNHVNTYPNIINNNYVNQSPISTYYGTNNIDYKENINNNSPPGLESLRSSSLLFR